MAKQIHGPLGGFVGKLGPLIGYRWRGRWCVRTRPQHVHNPRTEAQQRHRSLFRAEVQLAARMRWPIAMALTDEARRRHMTAQNLFVRLNHGLWQPADNPEVPETPDYPGCAFAPDYSRLQLSTGRLEAVCGVRAEVDADGVLRVRFDRCRPEQRAYAYDEVFLYAYSPSAGAGYLFNSVYRRTGRIDVLPPDWLQTDNLQLYLMCRSSEGRWSATVHAEPIENNFVSLHHEKDNSIWIMPDTMQLVRGAEGGRLGVGAGAEDRGTLPRGSTAGAASADDGHKRR